MCTVSWLINQNGYQLFFNRDEQRSRSKALPPQHGNINGVAVIMPKDPDGGGSWISVNERGFSLCLLNFYQGDMPSGSLYSRGQLLKSLSCCDDINAFNEQLTLLDLECYAPFTILAFELYSGVKGYQWDGRKLVQLNVNSPLTSSSVMFDKVSAARINSYCASMNTSQQHILYHSGHHPDKGYQSVCMHRSDAKTVSFSHICVSSEQASFTYVDGSPCLYASLDEDKKQYINHQSGLTLERLSSPYLV
ncbi:NRDE family protein [Neptunomonas japonica]|uniref:NRDE family protein n=1 Tax=Neptunomonas japonica TaxID=417574 RepID=UPI00040AA710|nr:NRDE family protein [Neptunomonas japonica]